MIADTNAPDEDHWTAKMTVPRRHAERGCRTRSGSNTSGKRRAGDISCKPPALIEHWDERHEVVTGYSVNPEADNISNLPADYYQKQIKGKRKDWIDSRLMVRVVLVVEGSPVWPMFRREVHAARDVLRPLDGHEVVVSLDFGRSPAALFMQAVNNRILIQHELIGQGEERGDVRAEGQAVAGQRIPEFDIPDLRRPQGQRQNLQTRATPRASTCSAGSACP